MENAQRVDIGDACPSCGEMPFEWINVAPTVEELPVDCESCGQGLLVNLRGHS